MSNPSDPNLETPTTPQYSAPVVPTAPAAPVAPAAPAAPQYAPPAAPQYAAPQQYVAVAPAAPTNVMAIVSLVTSIIGFSLLGVIFGHIAMNQIKRTGEQGHGLALAGLIIGYIFLGITVLIIGFYFMIMVFALSSSSF